MFISRFITFLWIMMMMIIIILKMRIRCKFINIYYLICERWLFSILIDFLFVYLFDYWILNILDFTFNELLEMWECLLKNLIKKLILKTKIPSINFILNDTCKSELKIVIYYHIIFKLFSCTSLGFLSKILIIISYKLY